MADVAKASRRLKAACEEGDWASVEMVLLSQVVEIVNTGLDSEGRTALYVASEFG